MVHFEIKNLSFYYPTAPEKPILSNINLKLEQGQYVTLCGRSGCGKTTLLKHLKTVLTPHGKREGEIYFEGAPLSKVDLKKQASGIGYVMQNPDNQIVTDKVWHELAFGLESLGLDQKTIRLRVAEMASYFGIQGWFHRNVSELSGGQKQLLNLASVMAMQPSVLILDEPTSQLDPIAASDFLNTIRKINRELRTTIIITEHRLEDVFYASDKVIVMEQGKIIADDEPRKVGEFLKDENSKMFMAMPTPVQIYYGVPNQMQCPLTVREGGEWLEQLFQNKTLKETKIEKKSEFQVSDEKRGTEKKTIENTAIEMKDVWFRYEKTGVDILKGVTAKIPKGSFYALVGGNGTGKSTMIKAVCGVCKPYRGKIKIDGKLQKKYKGNELFQGKIALLPQDPQSLFVKKTVREDLEEMLEGSREEKNEEIQKIAGQCEIESLLESHPFDLSGGEQQRVALAKVLLSRPEILMLDEPTKGLDSFFKIKFAQIMQRLKKEGMTILMVSHDVEFCAKYVDIISMFFDGNIITSNTPNHFFSKNSFYTTAANRMSRHMFQNAITIEDVIMLCQMNQ